MAPSLARPKWGPMEELTCARPPLYGNKGAHFRQIKINNWPDFAAKSGPKAGELGGSFMHELAAGNVDLPSMFGLHFGSQTWTRAQHSEGGTLTRS